MRRLAFALAASALLAAACTADGPTSKSDAPEAMAAAPPSAGGRDIRERNELLEFTYSWPAEAAAIPALVRRLESEADAVRAEAIAIAEADRQERAGGTFFPHSYRREWQSAGRTPRLLSLYARNEFFTGGAHPNSIFASLLWDREREQEIAPHDLLADPAAALARLTPAYCATLDRMRADKRGLRLPLQRDGDDDWMTACPALADQVVVPADRDGDGRFDRILILIPPYEAGPYAEGAYELVLPIDAEIRALLKPAYAESFAD